MWRIQKKEKFDIWENDLCSLKVQYEESKCRVYVNYKGYNVVVPMGICGFEDEIQERKIKYEVEGEKGILNSLSYVVEKDNLRLFCDMIFFFLTEHSLDRMFLESFNRFLIISLDVLICRYSPLFRAFPALFISEEPHKSFYYPLCFRSQK